MSNNKSFSVGVQSLTEINAPRECAVILRRICQLSLTRITHQVSRAFDLNYYRKKTMKIKTQKHGFTLVELIVVLTILVILASLLIPSLTGYIRKAKEKAIITEVTDVWKASQAALSECYAVYPESFTNPDPIKPPCRFATDIDGKRISNLGRITNAALNAVQINPNDQTEVNTSSRRITRQVLSYLDSADKSNARYLFTVPSGKSTWNTTFRDYFGRNPSSNAVLLQIFHTTDGKVIAINFGKDGYMVTIIPGKETTCVYNGKSLKSIGG